MSLCFLSLCLFLSLFGIYFSVWNMPKICQGLPLICLRYGQDMPAISLNNVWDLHEKDMRYAWDINVISMRYASNLPEICLRYAWDLLEICEPGVPEIYVRFKRDFLICLIYVRDILMIFLRFLWDISEIYLRLAFWMFYTILIHFEPFWIRI